MVNSNLWYSVQGSALMNCESFFVQYVLAVLLFHALWWPYSVHKYCILFIEFIQEIWYFQCKMVMNVIHADLKFLFQSLQCFFLWNISCMNLSFKFFFSIHFFISLCSCWAGKSLLSLLLTICRIPTILPVVFSCWLIIAGGPVASPSPHLDECTL